MKLRHALALAALGALLVPSLALADRGPRPSGDDGDRPGPSGDWPGNRFGFPWGGWDRQKQTFTLAGTELVLSGLGYARGHVAVPPPAAGALPTTPPEVVIKAVRGTIKVASEKPDLAVKCRGQGWKREWTDRLGRKYVVCKGVGTARIVGSDWYFSLKAKFMQATFPAGLTGEIGTWGQFWAGLELPENPGDVDL